MTTRENIKWKEILEPIIFNIIGKNEKEYFNNNLTRYGHLSQYERYWYLLNKKEFKKIWSQLEIRPDILFLLINEILDLSHIIPQIHIFHNNYPELISLLNTYPQLYPKHYTYVINLINIGYTLNDIYNYLREFPRPANYDIYDNGRFTRRDLSQTKQIINDLFESDNEYRILTNNIKEHLLPDLSNIITNYTGYYFMSINNKTGYGNIYVPGWCQKIINAINNNDIPKNRDLISFLILCYELYGNYEYDYEIHNTKEHEDILSCETIKLLFNDLNIILALLI